MSDNEKSNQSELAALVQEAVRIALPEIMRAGAQMPEPLDELLRIEAVMAAVSKSESAIWNDIAAGTFPPPIRIGERAIAWRRSTIAEWIASRPTWTPGPPLNPEERRKRGRPRKSPPPNARHDDAAGTVTESR